LKIITNFFEKIEHTKCEFCKKLIDGNQKDCCVCCYSIKDCVTFMEERKLLKFNPVRGIVGLVNAENNISYFHSTLQFLNAIDPLMNWFNLANYMNELKPDKSENNQYNNLNAIELIMELSCFYSNVWGGDEKTVNTSALKKTIDDQIDLLVKDKEKNEPLRLLEFLLFNIIENNTNKDGFIKKNFYGNFQIENQCDDCCKINPRKLVQFRVLPIILEKNDLTNYNLEECINHIVLGANCCKNCKLESPVKVYDYPNILIVNTVRKNRGKTEEILQCPMTIELKSTKNINERFSLKAIITEFGNTIDTLEYATYCKYRSDNSWRAFKENLVTLFHDFQPPSEMTYMVLYLKTPSIINENANTFGKKNVSKFKFF
jgi:hypothetical protein